MLMLVMNSMANNTMHIVKKLHAFVFNEIALNGTAFKVSL